jgi:mono/diheme cytochrome c family protein
MVVGIVLLTLIADVPTVSETGSKLLGILQAISGLIIPTIAIIALILMSFVFKGTSTRTMIWTTVLACVSMIIVSGTVLGLYQKPAVEETPVAVTLVDRITAGQDLYSVNCTECHGDDGSVAKIEGVKGLEGKELTPINSKDVLYTITDSAMYEVIAYGRPNAGMTPFGKAYGGELSKSDIDNIITYIRYIWDDRFEAPKLQPLYPPLADGEVPSYDVHIQPIVKRYCVSCHRAGKDNNHYLMTSYQEMLTTGDEAKNNIIAGDENSYLLQVIQGHAIMDPAKPNEELIGVMPPNSKLKPDVVNVFKLWIMNGMPETTAEAASKSTPPTPKP